MHICRKLSETFKIAYAQCTSFYGVIKHELPTSECISISIVVVVVVVVIVVVIIIVDVVVIIIIFSIALNCKH